MGDDTLINIDSTLRNLHNDIEGVKTLFELSIHEFSKWESALKTAIDNNDFEQLRKLAHRYKGSCDTLGMTSTKILFLEIQNQSESQNMDSVKKIFNKAFDQIDKVVVIMQDYIDS